MTNLFFKNAVPIRWTAAVITIIRLFFVPAMNCHAFGFPFALDIRESGSFTPGSTLNNRLNSKLYLPAIGFSFRFTASYEAPLPPKGEFIDGNLSFSGGVYHKKTGSRILAGALNTNGLIKRSSNVFRHALPHLEAHTFSSADLKTSGAKSGDESFYASLISPDFFKIFNVFGSVLVESFEEPAADWLVGAAVQLPLNSSLRFESLFSQKTLPQRKAGGWFSAKTYLPERDLRYYALSLVFLNPMISFASDFAQSEIGVRGSDIYGNASLRVGSDRSLTRIPFRLYVAIDGAGSRYAGSNAVDTGAGFRLGTKFEMDGKENSLVRVSTSVQSEGITKSFYRSNTLAYYKFPIFQNKKTFQPYFISLALDHDGRDMENITDLWTFKTVFYIGAFRPSFGFELKQKSSSEAGSIIFAYTDFSRKSEFESLKINAGLSCTIHLFYLRAQLSYTSTADKEAASLSSISAWGSYISASASFKSSSVNISFSDLGREDWSMSLSWKLQLHIAKEDKEAAVKLGF
ncbi:MAG: hypothetical protein Ta2G_09240 [Termitinemataceae bacterium]|nr:MAG: hypothetical protein Ta2G_09240 [Termitinemataceae bacterium]